MRATDDECSSPPPLPHTRSCRCMSPLLCNEALRAALIRSFCINYLYRRLLSFV